MNEPVLSMDTKMVEVLAIIRRHRAMATKSELSRIGCPGYTVFPALGRGRQMGISINGSVGNFIFLPRIVFQLVIEKSDLDETIEAIVRGNQTGEFGDGRIFVSYLDNAYRVSDRITSTLSEEQEPASMKMIKAIIRPEKETAVTNRLEQLNLPAMTKWDVLGRGRQKGIQVGGTVYSELAKLCLMLVVPEELLDSAVKAIVDAAQTGHPGDGRIFVSDVKHAYTIRTGELIN